MDWKYWLLVLVGAVFVVFLARRWQLARRLRKQLLECTTYMQANLICYRADNQGFHGISAEAGAMEQQLFTEFLSGREEQFKKDLEKAFGSEEKLFAVLNDRKYSDHVDPHFSSHVGKMVREQLRPFTEKRILEATSIEDLLSLTGNVSYLRNMFIGVLGGFNRIHETLESHYLQKAKRLVCKEAIASKSPLDLCFKVKTGDKFIDALIAIKKETIILSSWDPPFDLGVSLKEVDSALEKALERV